MRAVVILVLAVLVSVLFIGCVTPSSSDDGIEYPFARSEPEYRSIDDMLPGEVFEVELGSYAFIVDDMRENLERYLGKKITIDGFVFRHNHFPGEQFFVARLLVDCCVMDALFTGVLVEYDSGEQFIQESWVRVTGTVSSVTYHDVWTGSTYEAPLIIPDEVVQIDKPLVQYIYP